MSFIFFDDTNYQFIYTFRPLHGNNTKSQCELYIFLYVYLYN